MAHLVRYLVKSDLTCVARPPSLTHTHTRVASLTHGAAPLTEIDTSSLNSGRKKTPLSRGLVVQVKSDFTLWIRQLR